MIDRLISGAGAWAHLGDRIVRAVISGGALGGLAGRSSGSVVLGAAILVGAGFLAWLGLEATDNPTPRTLTAAEVEATSDFGRRTYATVSGRVDFTYVETFEDENANGEQDPGEDGVNWFYYLLDEETWRGVAVRSDRPPNDVYRFEARGVLTLDPPYVDDALDETDETDGWLEELGIAMERRYYLDTTAETPADAPAYEFGSTPRDGDPVTLVGFGAWWVEWCTVDTDGDGTCDDDEVDLYDVFVMDFALKRGIIVSQVTRPDFADETFTGMLRRDPAGVTGAKTAEDLDFPSLEITISDTYLLADGDAPASAPLAFGVAAVLLVVGATMLIGVAGGYLVYRRVTDAWSPVRRELATGESIPLRVTGTLVTSGGLVHVREAPAALVRVPVGPRAQVIDAPPERPVDAPPERPVDVPAGEVAKEPTVRWDAPAPKTERTLWAAAPTSTGPMRWGQVDAPPENPDAPDPGPVSEPAVEPAVEQAPSEAPSDVVSSDPPAPAGTTLVVERTGRPEGIAVGRDELVRLSTGRVLPFRGPRPAIRAVAGTGPLLLSFDSEDVRDRAVAELVAESGLTRSGDGTATRGLGS